MPETMCLAHHARPDGPYELPYIDAGNVMAALAYLSSWSLSLPHTITQHPQVMIMPLWLYGFAQKLQMEIQSSNVYRMVSPTIGAFANLVAVPWSSMPVTNNTVIGFDHGAVDVCLLLAQVFVAVVVMNTLTRYLIGCMRISAQYVSRTLALIVCVYIADVESTRHGSLMNAHALSPFVALLIGVVSGNSILSLYDAYGSCTPFSGFVLYAMLLALFMLTSGGSAVVSTAFRLLISASLSSLVWVPFQPGMRSGHPVHHSTKAPEEGSPVITHAEEAQPSMEDRSRQRMADKAKSRISKAWGARLPPSEVSELIYSFKPSSAFMYTFDPNNAISVTAHLPHDSRREFSSKYGDVTNVEKMENYSDILISAFDEAIGKVVAEGLEAE